MVAREMEIGAGGENILTLPGISLHQLGSDRLCGKQEEADDSKQPSCPIFLEPNQVSKQEQDEK